ncbi:MAG: tripartite tricarboxylate transporter substrate binding protein [Proteobacteria bacterium]|nr:tripartite tricarboxylate transporter substrate binding protein [Burkholderiales bacterium]
MGGGSVLKCLRFVCAQTARGCFALGLLGSAVAATVPGAWPERPIRLVHGFVPGGNVDITARLMAQSLSDGLGQPVIVDTRPGAGGTVAAALVAKALPDGYTLFAMASGHSISHALYRSVPYDPVDDFTMVSLVASFPFVIAVAANHPARTLADLMKMAKGEQGRMALAHAGIGTGMHMTAVLLQSRTGIKFNEVPYKGGTAAPLAAVQGEVAVVFDTPAGMEALVQAGRLRPLAVSFPQRWKNWPDVPTVAESVSPGFDVRGWLALAGPKGLPRGIVDRLVQTLHSGLARPEVTDRFRQMGSGATPTQPAETQKFLATEVARWRAVIRDERIAVAE